MEGGREDVVGNWISPNMHDNIEKHYILICTFFGGGGNVFDLLKGVQRYSIGFAVTKIPVISVLAPWLQSCKVAPEYIT